MSSIKRYFALKRIDNSKADSHFTSEILILIGMLFVLPETKITVLFLVLRATNIFNINYSKNSLYFQYPFTWKEKVNNTFIYVLRITSIILLLILVLDIGTGIILNKFNLEEYNYLHSIYILVNALVLQAVMFPTLLIVNKKEGNSVKYLSLIICGILFIPLRIISYKHQITINFIMLHTLLAIVLWIIQYIRARSQKS